MTQMQQITLSLEDPQLRCLAIHLRRFLNTFAQQFVAHPACACATKSNTIAPLPRYKMVT